MMDWADYDEERATFKTQLRELEDWLDARPLFDALSKFYFRPKKRCVQKFLEANLMLDLHRVDVRWVVAEAHALMKASD